MSAIMRGHGPIDGLLPMSVYFGFYGCYFPLLVFHFIYRVLALERSLKVFCSHSCSQLFQAKTPRAPHGHHIAHLLDFPAHVFSLVRQQSETFSRRKHFEECRFSIIYFLMDVRPVAHYMRDLFVGRAPSLLIHSADTAPLHAGSLYWVSKLVISEAFKLRSDRSADSIENVAGEREDEGAAAAQLRADLRWATLSFLSCLNGGDTVPSSSL